MKKPITLGTIFLITLAIYFVSVFFMYIDEYSFNYFWNESKPSGVYIYSAAFGYIIMIVGIPLSILYLIIVKGIPEFLVKLWNYPIIK